MFINFRSLKSGEGGLVASGLANRGFTLGLIRKTTTYVHFFAVSARLRFEND